MTRDPRILKDDLVISERRLARFHYEMQVIKYLSNELTDIKKIIYELDSVFNCNVCLRNYGEIIKKRYINIRQFWDKVSNWYKESSRKVPRDIVNPFRETSEYFAEAIATYSIYDSIVFHLIVPSTEFLFLLEHY